MAVVYPNIITAATVLPDGYDVYNINAASGSFTVTLPLSSTNGKEISLARTDSNIIQTVTIQPGVGSTIQGKSSIDFPNNQTIVLVWYQGTWFMKEGNIPGTVYCRFATIPAANTVINEWTPMPMDLITFPNFLTALGATGATGGSQYSGYIGTTGIFSYSFPARTLITVRSSIVVPISNISQAPTRYGIRMLGSPSPGFVLAVASKDVALPNGPPAGSTVPAQNVPPWMEGSGSGNAYAFVEFTYDTGPYPLINAYLEYMIIARNGVKIALVNAAVAGGSYATPGPFGNVLTAHRY
jgi:hypothetical protein